jgi:hypothetical protein
MYPLTNPITITTSYTISNFEITELVINLNVQAIVNVILMDDSGNYLGNRTYILEGTDYTSWGKDDTYIISYIQTQISQMTTM